MCGRYYRKSDKQNIAEAFHAMLVDDGTPSPPWDYNVALTTIRPIIRHNRDTHERTRLHPLGIDTLLHQEPQGRQKAFQAAIRKL